MKMILKIVSPFSNEKIVQIYNNTGCPKINWSLGFLPYMDYPVTCEHFRAQLNVVVPKLNVKVVKSY